ncbi:Polysaccharide deacetylase [Microbacterium hydrocarbonoxydans]|uniref:Polysaccharide deacetylase n=1 Tax=Microbacterium hydrocarbonoxydans TaxID=273678 RepID=A0A0M2HXJ0_9MICO|nr:polysaccharide deacetylase family protein [Microbacterium hydrocarbonoxydans]KJL49153.1 Polysaccharide deacetylase [Microbacterium hydrocarbonoxydans]
MTIVRISLQETNLGGFSPVESGVIDATYWAGDEPFKEVVGDQVRFPKTLTAETTGDLASMDMVPTAGACCVKWMIRITRGGAYLTRFTEIPDVPTVVFGDLVDVDPTTFEPSVEGKAAWDAAVEAAQSAVAGAVAAKDAARVSAEAAGDAADAAVPAASEAVSARDEAVAAAVALSGAVGAVDGLKTLTTTGRLADTALNAKIQNRQPKLYSSNPGGFRQIPVVMLHNLVSLADAQGRLKDYVSWGYQGIFFSELVNYLRTGDSSQLPEKPICITVDDGGLSNYSYLFPALVEYGMKATFFIVPAWVNGDITTPANGGSFLEASPFTWANAREMFASGKIEYQSHTLKHGSMRLLSGPGEFNGNGEGAGADYLACKTMVEANVPGAVVTASAAPYGVINETALASLASVGCTGQRITATGLDATGVYDGSGAFAFATPQTDPLRVPVTDAASSQYLRRANKFGEADADGNQFQNGKAKATQRGVTLPAGWTQPTVTLPQAIGTGPVFRGFGVAADTPMFHTDMIPVGLYGAFSVDWWVQATSCPTNGVRCIVEGYTNPADATPAMTWTDQDSNTSWKRKRWNFTGHQSVAWIKVSFEVAGATASCEILLWDIRVRRTRSAYGSLM